MAARILPMRAVMAQGAYGPHISEEEMDIYVRTCPPVRRVMEENPRLESIEIHLLICAECQERLQEIDDLYRALWALKR